MPTPAVMLLAIAMQSVDSTTSPTIRQLIDDLRRGNSGAESAFLDALAKNHAPIVESVDGDAKLRLVTFAYKGDATTKNAIVVTLQSDQLANDHYYPLARLYHITGTNIWYRTYRLPSDARFSYAIGPDVDGQTRSRLTDDAWAKKNALLIRDPFNDRKTPAPSRDESVVELPDAPPQPWIARRDDIPHGRIDSFTVRSAILGNERTIRVYSPPGLTRAARPARMIVMLDGEGDPDFFPSTTILDNLIADRRIPPTALVLVHNAPGARIREFWYNIDFVRAMQQEILPVVRRRHPMPECPANCAIAGHSLGGSAAMYVAFTAPTLFSGVIAQSGGFLYPKNQGDWVKAHAPDALMSIGFPQSEWLALEMAKAPRRPLRIYLETGAMEDVSYNAGPIPTYGAGTVLSSTRHMRDVLIAKGYKLRYNEYAGLHRVLSWRGTFGDAVIFVVGRDKSS